MAMTWRAPNLSSAAPMPGAANNAARLKAVAELDTTPLGHLRSIIMGPMNSPMATAPDPPITKLSAATLATTIHRGCKELRSRRTFAALRTPQEPIEKPLCLRKREAKTFAGRRVRSWPGLPAYCRKTMFGSYL
jgi:hypothetical protein